MRGHWNCTSLFQVFCSSCCSFFWFGYAPAVHMLLRCMVEFGQRQLSILHQDTSSAVCIFCWLLCMQI